MTAQPSEGGPTPSPRRRWSLKAYMLGLVVVFVVAAGINVAYQRNAARSDARDTAIAEARFAAGIAARDIAQNLAMANTTVQTTAANPALAQAIDAPPGCKLAFEGAAGSFVTGHLDIVARDGSVLCSSLDSPAAAAYAGAGWLAGALAAPTLVGPVADERTGKPVVVVAAPTGGRASLVAFLDLDRLAPAVAATLGGPRQLEFVVTDQAVIVSRSIEPSRWVGWPVAGTPFDTADARVERDDLDGVPRLYGQSPVEGIGWNVFAGADRDEALATADRLSARQLGITMLGLAVFLAAALVIYRRIARPIRELSASVRAASEAPVAKPIVVKGPAEVEALVDDFNRLLAAEAERRSLERRLNQSQRLESLGQLAGGVAHDFNNLLAVIMNYATFVGEETAGDPAVHADVEQIKEAADRAARLTRQLLIFARRETVEREVLALNDVVADIHKLLARSLGEHVEVVLRPGTDLPAIRADRGQVEQVLVNLAVNARDAMAGGGTLTIETTATDIDAIFAEAHPGLRAGSYVELVVSDTGAGMSPDVASRVFEPFFTTKGKGEGTGLGLATVYGIVTEAGGSVSVYSEEGIGTTFRAYFPAVDAAVGAAEAPAVAEAGAGRGETILVVEDDPGVLHMTSRILRENGYEVLEADGFAMAMELAATHEFQMLLTDSVMPHSSGGSLAELITAEHPGLPVLYMSGYGDGVLGPTRVIPDDAQLLRKPFTRRMLLEKVRALSATAPPRGHD